MAVTDNWLQSSSVEHNEDHKITSHNCHVDDPGDGLLQNSQVADLTRERVDIRYDWLCTDVLILHRYCCSNFL